MDRDCSHFLEGLFQKGWAFTKDVEAMTKNKVSIEGCASILTTGLVGSIFRNSEVFIYLSYRLGIENPFWMSVFAGGIAFLAGATVFVLLRKLLKLRV